MAEQYDLVVIGGGFGGYSAAIRAHQLGQKVALVEEAEMGGTCLNRGCIPTKALLKSTQVLKEIRQNQSFGLKLTGDVVPDFKAIQARKTKIIQQLQQGIQFLMKKNKITVYHGHATILGTSIFSPEPDTVRVETTTGDVEISAPHLLVATGSRPRSLPNVTIDEDKILSSTGVLALSQLPKSMAIVGGGVIGVELAAILNELSVTVTIIEYTGQLLPNENAQVAQQLLKQFKKQGIQVHLNTAVQTIDTDAQQQVVHAKKDQEVIDVQAERVLMAVGRQPNLEKLGLDAAGVQYTKAGITVDQHYQTNIKNIYAIGDVIPTLQLAHVAIKEGLLAVEHMVSGAAPSLNYEQVPRCVYTAPEIASVGRVDGQVNEATKAQTGQFNFQANGKAMIEGATAGQVKIFADKATDDLVGMSIMGAHATDMIGEGAVALYLNASPAEIAETVHPHPTLVEAVMEAAADVYQQAINQ